MTQAAPLQLPAVDRRAFLRGGLAGAGVLSLPGAAQAAVGAGFTHGVASGEPGLSWTRCVGGAGGDAELHCEVSDSPAFTRSSAWATSARRRIATGASRRPRPGSSRAAGIITASRRPRRGYRSTWTYLAARTRQLASARAADANLVVLSGDSHNAWANNLVSGNSAAGIEFGGHSVTSPGVERSLA